VDHIEKLRLSERLRAVSRRVETRVATLVNQSLDYRVVIGNNLSTIAFCHY
jgi:hypothetical protein